jgi:Zn-finger in ubiquitin-hydrolases and other protein
MPLPCQHLALIADVADPLDGCETCLAIGSTWHHLRQCLICGQTLCCDDSPNRHMTGHNRETGHPLMRSAEPGEDWAWCYDDEVSLQPTPGGWVSVDPFLETGLTLARRHLDAGRSLELADDFVTDDGFPLGDWVAYARERRTDGKLDAEETGALEALPGWRW